MNQKDSWYSLTPKNTHRDRPAVFAPKEISSFTTETFPQSAKAGMYTKGQLSEFWDAILMSSASKNALQTFTRNLIVPSNAKKCPDGYTYYAPRTDFIVDNMKSPNYFLEQICPDLWDCWTLAREMWNLVCHIPLHKLDYRHRRNSDANLRSTSDNRKISQFWDSYFISNVKLLHVFNTELSLFTSQAYRVFDAHSCRNARIYGKIYLSIQTLLKNAPNRVSPV